MYLITSFHYQTWNASYNQVKYKGELTKGT